MLRKVSTLLAATFVAIGGSAAAAQRADAYLHVANAAAVCQAWNDPAADSIMVGSVGRHIYHNAAGAPWSYWRYADDYVYVEILYTSNPNSKYAVRYACWMRGSDASMYAVSIAQTTSVYQLN